MNDKKAQDWFNRWGVTEKGSFSSGNYGHRGVPGQHGGSAPGGGHGSLGIASGMSKEEVKQTIEEHRQVIAAGGTPGEKIDGRPRSFAAVVGGKRLTTRQLLKRGSEVARAINSAERSTRSRSAKHRFQNARYRLNDARRFESLQQPKFSRIDTYKRAAEVIEAFDRAGTAALGFGKNWD